MAEVPSQAREARQLHRVASTGHEQATKLPRFPQRKAQPPAETRASPHKDWYGIWVGQGWRFFFG
jgi:hypothetical protein